MARATLSFTSILVFLLLAGCERDEYCTNTCRFAYDGECDDGRGGSDTSYCRMGTDCTDCGLNHDVDPPFQLDEPPPPPAGPNFEEPREVLVPSCECESAWSCEFSSILVRCSEGAPNGGCYQYMHWCDLREHVPGLTRKFECREGARGVGCYRIGATGDYYEECEPTGECEDGTAIERCVRGRTFRHPEQTSGFDVNDCHQWYQAGESVYDCGACLEPCNLGISEGEQLCGAHTVEPDAGPDDPVTPECRRSIEEVRASLRLSLGSCIRCVDEFVECAEANNCASLESCQNTAITCAMGCSP